MNKDQNMEQAILEAATKLFLEKGFKATSTTEIAKEAGCNQALVHYYFRTKDRLFDAIFEGKMKFFLGSLLKIENDDLSFKDKLARKIESHFDAIHQDPKLPFFFFTEISRNPGRLEQLREKLGNLPEVVLSSMKKELDEEIAKGEIRPITIYDLLLTIVSLNITVFITEPMFKLITRISNEEFNELILKRRAENVHIILSSLKPDPTSDKLE